MENNNQNSTNILSNRLAKSLLRFFRPVKVSYPRSPEDPKPPHHSRSASGNILFPNRKTKTESTEQRKNVHLLRPAVPEPAESTELAPLPTEKPGHWLDLVVYLIGACKKASNKIRSRKGVSSYQVEMQRKAQTRIKAVGSIVDTVTVINLNTDAEDGENPEEQLIPDSTKKSA